MHKMACRKEKKNRKFTWLSPTFYLLDKTPKDLWSGKTEIDYGWKIHHQISTADLHLVSTWQPEKDKSIKRSKFNYLFESIKLIMVKWTKYFYVQGSNSTWLTLYLNVLGAINWKKSGCN